LRGVALLGQGDELCLERLTHLLVECRDQRPAHRLSNRNHLFRREPLQQRPGEGGLGLFIHLVLLGMRAAEPDERRADARLPLIVFPVVKLVV
jgi:hypothetical protein